MTEPLQTVVVLAYETEKMTVKSPNMIKMSRYVIIVKRENTTMTTSSVSKSQEGIEVIENSTTGSEGEPETITDAKRLVQILRDKDSVIAMLKLDLISADARLCALNGKTIIHKLLI